MLVGAKSEYFSLQTTIFKLIKDSGRVWTVREHSPDTYKAEALVRICYIPRRYSQPEEARTYSEYR